MSKAKLKAIVEELADYHVYNPKNRMLWIIYMAMIVGTGITTLLFGFVMWICTKYPGENPPAIVVTDGNLIKAAIGVILAIAVLIYFFIDYHRTFSITPKNKEKLIEWETTDEQQEEK